MAVEMHWQVQQVKQRLSEVLRAAETEGPQFVTRHGKDVAVVINIDEYHQLKGGDDDTAWRDHLLAIPKLGLSDDEVDELFARDRRPDTREVPFVGPGWD